MNVCPLRIRRRFTTARFMVPPKSTAPPSSACGSQAARAVASGQFIAPATVRGVVGCAGCCVAAFNITASYAKRVRRKKSALRVRIRGRYVLRPSGECLPQGQIPSPAVRGSKTGLVEHHPFAFCCMVVPVYVWSCCGRFAAYVGAAFPLTSPHPPSGQLKQRHGRTRPHCHPLPWVNLHPRASFTGLRPASPAG